MASPETDRPSLADPQQGTEAGPSSLNRAPPDKPRFYRPGGFWSWSADADLRLRHAERSGTLPEVWPPEVVRGQSLADLPGMSDDALRACATALNGEPGWARLYIEDRVFEFDVFPTRNDDGAIDGVACFGRDVTLLVRSRERFREAERQLELIRLVVEQMSDGVVITDAEILGNGPRIVHVNSAFCRISGWSAEAILGQSLGVLIGPRTDPAMVELIRQTFTAGWTGDFEGYNYRRDGRAYLSQWRIAPLRDDSGVITHWVSIQRDITARRRVEDIARLRENELVHAGRLSAMGELASGLAHELNQPLAAIANYGRGALRRIDTPGGLDADGVRQTLERVADQADRAGEIIRRVRRFVASRETQRIQMNLADSAARVREMIDFELRARALALDLRVEADTPMTWGDPIQLEQVILNLVSNAMDAVDARHGAAKVRVCIGPGDGPRGEPGVALQVCDDGAGMDEQTRAKLFQPFFTTKPQGVGIGLVISESIVHAHQGRIECRPNQPHGTIFRVWLPVQRPDPARSANRA
ncbi:MAG: ATP-binding protein [Planctomycetota bacterium]